MLEIRYIVGLITALFNLIVIIASIRNFTRTHIPEFLLFSIGFFFGGYFGLYTFISGMLVPKDVILPIEPVEYSQFDVRLQYRIAFFIYLISPALTILFISIYFIRSIWLRPPLRLYMIPIFPTLMSMLANLSILYHNSWDFNYPKNNVIMLRAWIFFLPLLIFGILALILLLKLIRFDNIDAHTNIRVRELWGFAFIMSIITMFSEFAREVFISRPNLWDDEYKTIFELILSICVMLSFLPAAIIAIFYPQWLLVFEAHVVRAKTLYRIVIEKQLHKDKNNFLKVQEYLVQILNWVEE